LVPYISISETLSDFKNKNWRPGLPAPKSRNPAKSLPQAIPWEQRESRMPLGAPRLSQGCATELRAGLRRLKKHCALLLCMRQSQWNDTRIPHAVRIRGWLSGTGFLGPTGCGKRCLAALGCALLWLL